MGGKILTGIPELEQTFAGMAIECEVLLQGQGFTAEGPGNGVFKIALRNIKFNNFNEKLSGPEPLNWRTLVTPATSPVPEALKVFLESPVQGEMEAWKIKKVTLSADGPAGPQEQQVKMLQSLGLKSTLITDGRTPINLLNTANGLVYIAVTGLVSTQFLIFGM